MLQKQSGSFWAVDLNMQCWAGYHRVFAIGMGVPLLLIVCLGLLACILYKALSYRHKLCNNHVIRHYGSLFRAYKSRFCWWESVVVRPDRGAGCRGCVWAFHWSNVSGAVCKCCACFDDSRADDGKATCSRSSVSRHGACHVLPGADKLHGLVFHSIRLVQSWTSVRRRHGLCSGALECILCGVGGLAVVQAGTLGQGCGCLPRLCVWRWWLD
ncbi:hypothetical protein COO60DRAFT_147777 [Scenedesmus sp. NREL 46B-D3]|nr:hypothetical protein COO60DRAFT_147777 [Scenedesmus sp. NREL 46B-D3]